MGSDDKQPLLEKHGLRISPIRLIAFALVLTMGLLLFTGWQIWRSYREYQRVLVQDARLLQEIRLLEGGNDLPEQAIKVAETGNLDLVEVYEKNLAKVTAALGHVISEAPDPSILYHARAMDASNTRLMELERRAFDHASQGRLDEAVAVFRSPDYQQSLGEYDSNYGLLQLAAAEYAERNVERLEFRALVALYSMLTAIPIVLLTWLIVLRLTKADLERQRKLEHELRDLSLRDALTELHNRRGFMWLAEQYLRLARRNGRDLLLLFCDLDGLKAINDEHGHDAGDTAIKETAVVLRQTFREADLIARVGGDEFVVMTMDADRRDTARLIGRIRMHLAGAEHRAALEFPLSVSIGTVTHAPGDEETLEELLKRADRRMYEEKNERRMSRHLVPKLQK